MNSSASNAAPRQYQMSTRARQTKATRKAILDAARKAFHEHPYETVTLSQIAQTAGVTEQTVIRHMQNKDGLFTALVERELPRVMSERTPASGPDCSAEEAIQALAAHYRREARAMLGFLNQRHRSLAIDKLLGQAQQAHELWVKTFLSEVLGPSSSADYPVRLNALVAVTDINLWKALCVDRGLSDAVWQQTLMHLIDSLKLQTQCRPVGY